MSGTQQPEPITAWATTTESGRIDMRTVWTTRAGAIALTQQQWLNTPFDQLEALGIRVVKIEIREVTQ